MADRPLLAIISLRNQHISIYGANGKLLQSPVSSGQAGYETPAGIFSIVQKKRDHYSNLYMDGEMPHMQRITWTGIALHGGVVPGYPASHGCVRLPKPFARRLFGMTELGMRVVIVRNDMLPSDISHPALFKSRAVSGDLVAKARRFARLDTTVSDGDIAVGSARHLEVLQSIAAARAQELEAAAERQRKARAAARRAASEAVAAARRLRAATAGLARAERALKLAEKGLESATSPKAKERAETAKAKALAGVEELQAPLEAIRSQERGRRDTAERAREEVTAAAAAKSRAAQAAQHASLATLPVSVFVSRKTRRLYVRRGTHPVFEAPVTIRDPHKPIGTFVFTALDRLGASREMRWNVVAMYKNPTRIEPAPEVQPRGEKIRAVPAAPTDVAAAGAALDRITMTREARDIISSGVVLPGSSLIVSDEGPSRETGKDTDFVVVMSGEPQGALKKRKRETERMEPMDAFSRSPWGGSPFFWDW